ncbi:unnamed protein product [Rotaria socialis]|uniref:Rrn7/TAF1B N-terminal cyclin domain-containing protein n=1 Tax=Rotaria socialis TaxID=392032 RepID=A0A818QFZ0_9BILA|nr:unnamed protein product [Rotaria socialis]CAF4366218.1 unnamed protein product [Rotaria socialis]
MSHQLCQNCGSNQFEHIDGRLYCIVCQSQNISLQIHVSFANEGNAQLGRRVRDQTQTTSIFDETIPKIEIFEANETLSHTLNQADETVSQMSNLSVDDNEQTLLEQHVWSSYEVYSYILNIQIQSIIHLDYIKKEKQDEFIECTFMLYLRYLSTNGILDTNQQRLLIRQEEKRLKTNIISKLLHADRFNQFAKLNSHLLKKQLCILNLDILIGLIHCACTLINCPITIKQLIELTNTNKLPYYNIKTYLPNWMRATGRDRFNLEKMNIHSGNLFFYYTDFIQPVIKPYISKCIFQSSSYFYEILLHFCEIFCQQIYFPFDDHTRILFESMCRRILEKKSIGRRFLCSSFDMELTSISIIIVIILLRSINDSLLDEFIQHINKKENHQQLFSYSLWLQNLNYLTHLQSIRYYEFYGRKSVLLESITDNHSKLRYMKHLSKVFDRNVELNNEKKLEEIYEKENQIRHILIENSKPGSLIYAIKPKEFFLQEFQHLSSNSSLPTIFESIVNTYSPSHFSIVDKSELYETLLSLFNGTTIHQIENFYLLHQRFDFASSTNFHLNHLIMTLTKFSSIPYNQDFYSFLSIFLKTFCFHDQHLHHYFYQSTFSKRFNSKNIPKDVGRKQYGMDQLPIIYDLKFEQERPLIKENKT